MIGAIIQARLSSTRLPQKVILRVEGKTILEHVIDRVKRIRNCKKIILATTVKKEDDILERIAKKSDLLVYRGSENDVLDRCYQASKLFKIDPIIRITADCPLLDPKVVDRVMDLNFEGNYDYVSNTHPPTFPDGMDVEIFNFKSLKKSWKEVKLKSEREHVAVYIFKNPKLFKIGNITNSVDLSHLRFTLDEKEDLILIKKIYHELYKNPNFGLKDILELLERKPELIRINQYIKRNEGYLKSLREDKIYEK